MTTSIVAAAQLGPASATKADTVARIARLVAQAGAEGAALVVFPELALTPYFAAVVHDDPTPFFERELRSSETAPIFAAIAASGVEVVLPFAERSGAHGYNSAALIGAAGEIGRYRKMHIPGHREPLPDGSVTFMEKRYFAPGNLGFPVFDAAVGRVGMLVCYDRTFPESYRCLALGGAEIIAIGHNSPVEPDAYGTTAWGGDGQAAIEELPMRAGASANGVYVIAAGKVGSEGGMDYIGGSLVIGPGGEVLARATADGDQLALAEIDLEAARQVRARLNLEMNRRPDAYGIIGG